MAMLRYRSIDARERRSGGRWGVGEGEKVRSEGGPRIAGLRRAIDRDRAGYIPMAAIRCVQKRRCTRVTGSQARTGIVG